MKQKCLCCVACFIILSIFPTIAIANFMGPGFSGLSGGLGIGNVGAALAHSNPQHNYTTLVLPSPPPQAAVDISPQFSLPKTTRENLVMDANHHVHMIAILANSNDVMHFELGPNGIISSETILVGSHPTSVDLAFDRNGELHALIDSEHFIKKNNLWVGKQSTPWQMAGLRVMPNDLISSDKSTGNPARHFLSFPHFVKGGADLIWAFSVNTTGLVLKGLSADRPDETGSNMGNVVQNSSSNRMTNYRSGEIVKLAIVQHEPAYHHWYLIGAEDDLDVLNAHTYADKRNYVHVKYKSAQITSDVSNLYNRYSTFRIGGSCDSNFGTKQYWQNFLKSESEKEAEGSYGSVFFREKIQSGRYSYRSEHKKKARHYPGSVQDVVANTRPLIDGAKLKNGIPICLVQGVAHAQFREELYPLHEFFAPPEHWHWPIWPYSGFDVWGGFALDPESGDILVASVDRSNLLHRNKFPNPIQTPMTHIRWSLAPAGKGRFHALAVGAVDTTVMQPFPGTKHKYPMQAYETRLFYLTYSANSAWSGPILIDTPMNYKGHECIHGPEIEINHIDPLKITENCIPIFHQAKIISNGSSQAMLYWHTTEGIVGRWISIR